MSSNSVSIVDFLPAVLKNVLRTLKINFYRCLETRRPPSKMGPRRVRKVGKKKIDGRLRRRSFQRFVTGEERNA